MKRAALMLVVLGSAAAGVAHAFADETPCGPCVPPSGGCGEGASAKCPADPFVEWTAKSAAAKTADDRFAVGLWCREKGLLAEASAEFREAVRLDPEHAASREALGDRRVDGRWVGTAEAMARKGLVLHDGRWLLPEEKAALEMPAAERERARREEDRARDLLRKMAGPDIKTAELAKAVFQSIEDRHKVTPLGYALRSTSSPVRMLAARELGRIKDRRTLRALVHRAVRDADPEVRAACFDAAKAFGDPELVAPFVRTLLNNPEPEPRAAAADAIGRSGDLRGVQYLVYALEAHGGGPRAHIYGANQLTFVQDFDVEVAQTAFIADPQVGLIQDGFALDVKVVSSEVYQTRIERHAIVGALKRLSGADLGEDAAAWRNWARENREKLVASAK
ncbi:MAG TPA: HEAT repeat domain-containing protein [Planctomycetota bacterium]|nr:HEAT repeat domain-containing protein [Planctomycetota bacterium]